MPPKRGNVGPVRVQVGPAAARKEVPHTGRSWPTPSAEATKVRDIRVRCLWDNPNFPIVTACFCCFRTLRPLLLATCFSGGPQSQDTFAQAALALAWITACGGAVGALMISALMQRCIVGCLLSGYHGFASDRLWVPEHERRRHLSDNLRAQLQPAAMNMLGLALISDVMHQILGIACWQFFWGIEVVDPSAPDADSKLPLAYVLILLHLLGLIGILGMIIVYARSFQHSWREIAARQSAAQQTSAPVHDYDDDVDVDYPKEAPGPSKHQEASAKGSAPAAAGDDESTSRQASKQFLRYASEPELSRPMPPRKASKDTRGNAPAGVPWQNSREEYKNKYKANTEAGDGKQETDAKNGKGSARTASKETPSRRPSKDEQPSRRPSKDERPDVPRARSSSCPPEADDYGRARFPSDDSAGNFLGQSLKAPQVAPMKAWFWLGNETRGGGEWISVRILRASARDNAATVRLPGGKVVQTKLSSLRRSQPSDDQPPPDSGAAARGRAHSDQSSDDQPRAHPSASARGRPNSNGRHAANQPSDDKPQPHPNAAARGRAHSSDGRQPGAPLPAARHEEESVEERWARTRLEKLRQELLDVEAMQNPGDRRTALRKLQREVHPDKLSPELRPHAEPLFHLVQAAWEANEALRAENAASNPG